jgi:hypothetical protein
MRDRALLGILVVPFLMGAAAAPKHPGHASFSFADPEIVESSGLALRDGLFVTTNDSGDRGRVFTVDPATGKTVGVTSWADDPTDVEALAPAGDGEVWVGDIGDNGRSRSSLTVARVPVGPGFRTVTPPTFELTYPDGAADAETLLANPRSGRLYVATKDIFGGVLYAAPKHLSADGPNRLRERGSVLAVATDGAFFPDGRHLIVRNYTSAAVYTFPGLEMVDAFPLPDEHQGEGIAVAQDGRVYVSSEGQDQPVLRAPLSAAVRKALAAPRPSPSSSPSPDQPSGQPSGDDRQPSEQPTDRPAWPWLVSAGAVLAGVLVLVRSMRPR